MTKQSGKKYRRYGQIPLHGISPEEIFQFLRDHPGSLPHQTKVKEEKLYEVFFDFFIDYFYMEENIDLKDFMNSLERGILVKILDRFKGNQRNTATFLSINHTTLNQKVRKHKISFFKKLIEG